MIIGSSAHNSSSPSPPTSNLTVSNFPDNANPLMLNAGVPQRKKRSIFKICLWFTGITIVAMGSFGAFSFFKNVFDVLQHPYRDIYLDENRGEVVDWSQVVRPMILKDSTFDVIASVWARDDDLSDGKDAVLRIDGEDRPEKLIFTGRVFKNVDVNDKTRFANVELQVPTHHFKQANLSNYDLRASFVLVHSDENRPSWLDFAKGFTTWKPQSLESPSVRKHDADPTLEDKIYDSFGITIPLVEFHNIASKRSGNIENTTETLMIEDISSETEADLDLGDELDWMGALFTTPEKRFKRRNTFDLEFSGEPVTEYHPYIVSRTHLRILKQDKLLKRLPYVFVQRILARKTCMEFLGISIQGPQWYQCHRSYHDNGVFETMVQVQAPLDSESEIKTDKEWKIEWLYAPYLSAMSQAAGPKDIVPIPVDRENRSQDDNPTASSSEEEYVTVNWRLSFSSLTQGKLIFADSLSSTLESIYDMTEPDALLEDAQRDRDVTLGALTHRIDQDAHPRRIFALAILTFSITTVCSVLNVHYFYTLTSTAGLSHLGAMFLCLAFFWDGVNLSNPALQIIGLIEPVVIFVAVSRLKFSWSYRKRSKGEKDGEKKKSWIPGIHFAKATHVERTSERFEARVSKQAKLLLFMIVFAAATFIPTSYLLSPRVQIPDSLLNDPLPPFLHPVVAQFFPALVSASFFTGHILQLIMNYSCQTYAGSYKITSFLWLIGRGIEFLDALPIYAGTTSRIHGIRATEGFVFVIAVVDFAQAKMYRNAKSINEEDVE